MTATRDIVERLRAYPRDRNGNFDTLTYTLDGNEAADEIVRLRALLEPIPTAPHTRTGYTTADPSEGEQAKPCYPDPVMDAVRRCAEIALEDRTPGYGQHRNDMEALAEIQRKNIADRIRREFGLLPTSET